MGRKSISEDGIRYEYKSDFDILVITETKLNHELSNKWRETEKLVKEMSPSASVNLIHHSYSYVKNELSYGSYFFTDVVKEAIVLYDNVRNGPESLVVPGSVDPEKVKERAREEYGIWFESANKFYKGYKVFFNDGDKKEAVLMLHQTTERLYAALLLAFTGYKPKIYDIEESGSQSETINEEFKRVFPRDTPEQDERYKLLKKAYIDESASFLCMLTRDVVEFPFLFHL